MPIQFPPSPSVNQEYTYSGKVWAWDGSSWVGVRQATGIQSSNIWAKQSLLIPKRGFGLNSGYNGTTDQRRTKAGTIPMLKQYIERDLGEFNSEDIVSSGLVLYLDAGNISSYSGSGSTWTDLSGNSNTATLTASPTYDSSNSGSLLFNGSTQWATITNPSTLRNQNFTVSIWFKPATQSSAIKSLIDFNHVGEPAQGWVMQSEDATTNKYWYLAYNDGAAFQPVGNFGEGKGIQFTSSVWQNFVYTKSGTSVIGYRNGTETFTATASSATVSYVANKNMRIAGLIAAAGREFNGNISQVLMYNREISATEVTSNYNAVKNRYGL